MGHPLSPISRWIIGVVGLAFAIATFYVGATTPVASPAGVGIMGAFLLLIPLACAGRRPGRIAGRIIAAVVFATCVGYLVSETVHPHSVFEGGQYRKSAQNWLNAILAMVTFGLPAGCYAALGRFSLRIDRRKDEPTSVVDRGVVYDD